MPAASAIVAMPIGEHGRIRPLDLPLLVVVPSFVDQLSKQVLSL